MTTANSNNELLPHLFRNEFAKMTAVLCRHFGLQHIEIAEDIVSDTFLKASELWGLNGLPDNPTAWLYTVAKNQAKDYLKRRSIYDSKVIPAWKSGESIPETTFEFTVEMISDSQLAMIFAVCNPNNSKADQISLALNILCGFSIHEIAAAFLTKPETIKKRLQRAKNKLRNEHFEWNILHEKEIKTRLDTVLKTLYLLFNEGYFSKNSNRITRKELCAEAMRLNLILTENPHTNLPQVHALLALMCFQSSRLNARIDEQDEAILFEDQDQRLWDQSLIEKGNYYLLNAHKGNVLTSYHLEAGIAYWHTTPPGSDKWPYILQLYNELLLIEYSPITALNRMFALSRVYGNDRTIRETEQLNLHTNQYYHSLLGYLYASRDPASAIFHYQQAIALTKSGSEKRALTKQIERLTQK